MVSLQFLKRVPECRSYNVSNLLILNMNRDVDVLGKDVPVGTDHNQFLSDLSKLERDSRFGNIIVGWEVTFQFTTTPEKSFQRW